MGYLAALDDVAIVGQTQRPTGVLLDQNDGRPGRSNARDVGENVLDDARSQTGGRFIEKQDARAGTRARAIASICCSPPDKAPAGSRRRAARTGKRW